MPHTTTKNQRLKRIDTRPNEKQRRKMKRSLEDAKTIQDLRVTSVQKSDKKQRLEQQTKLVLLSKSEKALRALKKKLNSINELLEKQQSGIELDAQQTAKTMTLDKVLSEMNELLSNSIDNNNVEDST